MNSNRSYNGPNRQRHNTGGGPPRSAQRPDHNSSNRFTNAGEYNRTLERKNEELTAEIVSLRDLNFTLQLTIKEMRKELQGRPAAKTAAKTAEKSGPRQNDPIRTDTVIHRSLASALPPHTPEERRAIDAEIKALVDKVLHRKP